MVVKVTDSALPDQIESDIRRVTQPGQAGPERCVAGG